MIQKKKFSEAIAANISVVEGLLPQLSTISPKVIADKAANYIDRWFRIAKGTYQNLTTSFILNASSSYQTTSGRTSIIFISCSGYGINNIAKLIASSGGGIIKKIRIVKKQTTAPNEPIYIDVMRTIPDEFPMVAACVINAELLDPYDSTDGGVPEGYTEEIIEL